MIVVKLKGGLGNQMFQYAFGKSLSVSLSKTMVLDKTHLHQTTITNETPREYELGIFDLPEKVMLNEWSGIRRFGNFFGLLKTKNEVYITDSAPLDMIVASKHEKIILDGYFQKENYFKKNEAEIRKAFTFKGPLDKLNTALLTAINQNNSVSIHVRRGDYINNPITNAYHGVCSTEYYQKAIEILKKSFSDLHFFVFSDDMEWCKINLNLDEAVTFITNNQGNASYKDLQLMSACKHHIIANSSFSWWGAWLNNSLTKKVIAPVQWFADPTILTNDLYPKDWQLI